ncbi:MAG: acyl-CoA dehydrogenase C-terminal domain-containing protein [Proteobacteria bacterium]|nr:acyl-CoA dehydrogenase C-terminal domain-containing protein [Pseudomonadota bacterium]
MSEYVAPIADMKFVIEHIAGLDQLRSIDGFSDATPELVEAILEEAAKLATEVLSPLNRVGDLEGSKLVGDSVQTPPGWREAYTTFIEAGWASLAGEPEFGGQGLPKLVATAVSEMWNSANLSFALCPMLTQGALDAIAHHAAQHFKELYVAKLISGEWTGTMNLTEPQAGSDLSAVRTKAVPEGDHYRISGQKIFITYGEHDLTENIIHMVLARTPDAPAGTRGISLFIVPKFLVSPDGSLGERNDLRCVSLEHKLGIHASPTAVMSYGDKGGAIGYLVGEENRGLSYMFTMMNSARHAVGLEGVAITERAYQRALEFARDRIQGQPIGPSGGQRAAIIEHPDVRRMLMLMKCHAEAMRSLAYVCATAYDLAARSADKATAAYAGRRGDFLTPIVKGWSTEMGIELASLGVQIHGGMGFIEETGAAQLLRDARITTIYEGTTGIQAADLVGRKTLRDGGAAAKELLEEIAAVVAKMSESEPQLADIRRALDVGVRDVRTVLEWMVTAEREDPRLPAAASGHYLKLWGVVCGGWQMAKAAQVCWEKLGKEEIEDTFLKTKIATAHFYAGQVMPQTQALTATIVSGSASVLSLDAANF